MAEWFRALLALNQHLPRTNNDLTARATGHGFIAHRGCRLADSSSMWSVGLENQLNELLGDNNDSLN